MKYIIADDLSGANDTGVQFTKKGYRVKVLIFSNQPSIDIPKDIDVIVIDTETREVNSAIAQTKIRHILENITIDSHDFSYKKIDSTLRGNIGQEIETMMSVIKKDICLITPSFPPQGRFTINHTLVIDPDIIPKKQDWTKGYKVKKCKDIFSLLQEQTSLSIGMIHLDDIRKGQAFICTKIKKLSQRGKKIIIADAVIEQDLKKILQSGIHFGPSLLFSGSAGLAAHFPVNESIETDSNDLLNEENYPFLIVAGSRNPVMKEQIRYLKKRLKITELIIRLEPLFSEKEKSIDLYASQCINAIQNGQNVLIYTDSNHNENRMVNKKIMLKYQLSFRELEVAIKRALGKITQDIAMKVPVNTLILTGGDVALGVCEAMGIDELNISKELLPGIPLTKSRYQGRNLNIITKAGGFGKKKTLYDIVKKLTILEKTRE